VRTAYLEGWGVDGRIILKLKLKGLVLRVLTGSVWIRMFVPGRLCNGVVVRMFLVSSECLDQLRDCDILMQYCSTLNCVGMWQSVQTLHCPTEDSVILCCCTMTTGKLIHMFCRLQIIHLFLMSVTINKLTYISAQQFNCQQHHHCKNL
jgi:hypothetical protein